MRLFKFVFEIRYSKNPPDIFRYREKIISAVASSVDNHHPDLDEGFQFLIKQKKAKVVIENRRLGFDIFLTQNLKNQVQYIEENAIKIIKLINAEMKINKINRIGVRTVWFQPKRQTFQELLNKYKEVFLKNNSLSNRAKDIAIPFTMEENGNKINYQTAPMEKEQINDIISSNLKNIQDTSVFTIDQPVVFFDYDYYKDGSINFSDDFAVSYIKEALSVTQKSMLETKTLLT